MRLIDADALSEKLCETTIFIKDGEVFQRMINDAPTVSAEAVKVAYICDGRKCDGDCSDCFRTLDIEHAKDFKLMGGVYYQQESAEAEPTVIRSRTLLPTIDFKEWARRVREENPNVIVIPCDAEVVSAEAEWIPVSERLPEDDEIVLTTDNKGIVCPMCHASLGYHRKYWFTAEEGITYREDEIIAWMPLPEPYKGGDEYEKCVEQMEHDIMYEPTYNSEDGSM